MKEGWVNKQLSRRTLLKGALTVGTGLAAALALGCEEEGKIPTLPTRVGTSPTPEAKTTPEKESLKLLWQTGFRRGKFSSLEWRGAGFEEKRLKPFLISSDGVYLTDTVGKFTKLDLDSGQPSWPIPWENAGTPLAESDGVIAVAREDLDRIYGLDINDGVEVWKYKAEGKFDSEAPPVIFDDLIYFLEKGNYTIRVGEVNPSTGVTIRLQTTDDELQRYAPTNFGYGIYEKLGPVTNERILLNGLGDGNPWFGIDRQTGEIVWVKRGEYTRLQVANSKLIFTPFTEGFTKKIITIDILTGDEKRFPILESYLGYFPGVVVGNKAVISRVSEATGTLGFKTLDLVTGEVSPLVEASELLGSSGEILYLAKKDAILAHNANTNQILWENDEVIPEELLTADEEQAFVSTKENNIVALDTQTGSRIWKFEFGKPVPSVLLTENSLILGTSQLFFLDRKTGQQRQPPLSVGDSVVTIQSEDKLLFVEGTKTLTVLG
jgi:outer membrane protein assembly factor BamB